MKDSITDILFLDIETVRGKIAFDELSGRMKEAWIRKTQNFQRDSGIDEASFYHEKAGIFAEFGSIIVIGLGYFHRKNGELSFRTKVLYGDDESLLLKRFSELLLKFDQQEIKLCAHNGKLFDFPFISRRMIINGLPLPESLQIAGKKPWEINHLDTMELWRFGDYKHFVSLELLAALFNIESSKTDLDGSMVGDRYYEGGDLESIARYCHQDVEVTAKVYLHLSGLGEAKFDTNSTMEHLKPDNTHE